MNQLIKDEIDFYSDEEIEAMEISQENAWERHQEDRENEALIRERHEATQSNTHSTFPKPYHNTLDTISIPKLPRPNSKGLNTVDTGSIIPISQLAAKPVPISKKALTYEEILDSLKEVLKPVDFREVAFHEDMDRLAGMDPNSVEAGNLAKEITARKIGEREYIYSIIRTVKEELGADRMAFYNGSIHLYNNAYWLSMDHSKIDSLLVEAGKLMGMQSSTVEYVTFRKKLLEQFYISVGKTAPNTNPNKVLINLQNGTFEITKNKRELRPFEARHFLTYQLPFQYNPKATAPKFQAYLDDVLPDKEVQKLLSEFYGSIFIKNGSNILKLEKILVNYGSGENGKSVMYELIKLMLGEENVSKSKMRVLTNEEKGAGERANIAGKLINFDSEAGNISDVEMFKQLISGEAVRGRVLYRDATDINQYAKFAVNVNTLPKATEHTNAFFRRMLIIPFKMHIPKHKQNKNLHNDIFQDEAAGVFNWMLEGLERVLSQGGFSECRASDEALQEYIGESMDSVQRFIHDTGYRLSTSNEVSLKELHDYYTNIYCEDNGYVATKDRTFAKRLRELGYTIKKMNYGRVVYIELKQPAMDS